MLNPITELPSLEFKRNSWSTKLVATKLGMAISKIATWVTSPFKFKA